MRNHRITKPDFRPCSTCWSRSQAPLLPLHSSNDFQPFSREPFGRLRYLLGGDRPSQTAHLTLSPTTISGAGKRGHNAGVVSAGASSKLAFRFLRLLPILYMRYRHSISNYSKAPWGLSVLSRVTCIFTGTKISPSLSLRQCPIVSSLVPVGTYPTRNFAYLGPL